MAPPDDIPPPADPRERDPLLGALPNPYVTKASSTVTDALKEPAKSKAMAGQVFAYNRSNWASGVMREKTAVNTLKNVGK